LPLNNTLAPGEASNIALNPLASPHDVSDGPLDLGAFLARAHARPLPAAQVDAAFARANHASIDAVLARLPADLPSLAAPLDAEGLARWLALFRAEDPALEALVESIVRSVEPR
jgi:hypothetical protein